MADPARAMKVADRIKTVTAEGLGQVVKDPDLGFVTITDVRVTNDLQHASIFYTVLGDEAQRARTAALLESHRGRLRSLIGKNLGIRLTPSIEFIADAIPDTAKHVEELLREAKERDAQVAAAAAGATYAGDPDPYRRPADDDAADDDAAGDDAADDEDGAEVAGAVGGAPVDPAPAPTQVDGRR
jgi:ribosome-binding factor A